MSNRRKLTWIQYSELPPNAKKAIYHYMVKDGEVLPEEYETWVRQFRYRLETFPAEKVESALTAWGWQMKEMPNCPHENSRIRRIQRLRKMGKGIWPYIVGIGHTFEEWAKDEMNHGDGCHRMAVSLQENQPVQFLFLRNKVPIMG